MTATPRRVLISLEMLAAASTLLAAWGFGIKAVTAGDFAGLPSLALATYLLLLLAGSAGAVLGLFAAWRGRHGWAAIGFVVGAVSPSFFFYVGNLALVVCAINELVVVVSGTSGRGRRAAGVTGVPALLAAATVTLFMAVSSGGTSIQIDGGHTSPPPDHSPPP